MSIVAALRRHFPACTAQATVSAAAIRPWENKLGQVAARLAADATMRWTALSSALGRMLPSGALSFGA